LLKEKAEVFTPAVYVGFYEESIKMTAADNFPGVYYFQNFLATWMRRENN